MLSPSRFGRFFVPSLLCHLFIRLLMQHGDLLFVCVLVSGSVSGSVSVIRCCCEMYVFAILNLLLFA